MADIDASWRRISDWFRTNQPEVLDALRGGASPADIENAEKAMGVQFPSELRAWYALADGSDTDYPSVFDDGHWFLPLSEAVSHHGISSQFADGQPVDDFTFWRAQIEDHVISVKGPVKPHLFSLRWIPITSSNGDVHRYVDLDPAPGGNVGQVIEHYPEACSHEVLAPSLGEYLERHAERLESGALIVQDGSLVDPNADDAADWGLPDFLRDTGESVSADGDTDTGPGEQIFVGDMGMLMGSGDEVIFTLHPADGRELTFRARRKRTRGYGTIRIEQRAQVRAVSYDGVEPTMFEAPDFEVLEYKRLG